MNLFDRLVEEAMQSEQALGTVRPALEKELLHRDILRVMNGSGLLAGLTFIGGTCLRACYGSPRLSEDLDFTGGIEFRPDRLAGFKPTLETNLLEKYGLPVSVSDPEEEPGNTHTWKVRIQTRPAQPHLPAQRIHIDICALPSHHPRPVLLRNPYGVNMGTEGLILQAQTREEIFADKWVALALRPNRVKYRDLWDLLWMEQQGIRLDVSLLRQKLEDRQKPRQEFLSLLRQRIDDLQTSPKHPLAFCKEMERFLPSTDLRTTLQQPQYWMLLMLNLRDQTAGIGV